MLRPLKEPDQIEYLNLSRLDNAGGTGFLPLLRRTEAEIFSQTEEFLKAKRTAAELADFQNQMAEKALTVMRSIR